MAIYPSMWSAYLIQETPEEMIDTLQGAGYEYTELSDEHSQALVDRGNQRKTGREYRKFIDAKGFKIPQGHLYLRSDISAGTPEKKVALFELFSKWFELYDAIGIKNAVLHPIGFGARDGLEYGSGAVWENTVANLAKLLEMSRGASFRLCLENLITEFNSFDKIEQLIEATPGGEELRFCLDTGHLALNNGDCAEYIRKAGSRLCALHITDCVKCPNGKHDHYLPTVGDIDWLAVVTALKEVGYDGLFNYEVPHERRPTRGISLLKLRYSRQLAEELLGSN